MMVELIGVSKVYPNGVIALSNINLSINKGEFVFVVGSSGAGKSTLIKLLLKEEEPTTGQIIVNGEDISRLKRSKIPHHRRNIGVVFQDFRLLPNKTVYENIEFAMLVAGNPIKDVKKHIYSVLDMVGLVDKANSYPHQLSGGEQQRVSLARAVVNKPLILIADEPTGNLDPDNSWAIMQIINDINRRGTTVLMVTHAKDIVDRMRKRVVTLVKGNIVKDQIKGAYDI
ncbi:cell division ATP-binding protein FtsE [Caldanaerobius fijiensis DSM 17918]|uniref:Cell division ATP-binding protein FtsE n=2 Tax=Caldanaerobius TaxID=862261 RepID=A0A1M5DE64_9THEO|nr:cell division ATP-binding protein FtsE [Caldanaerobius fijiensis DSM 17918]